MRISPSLRLFGAAAAAGGLLLTTAGAAHADSAAYGTYANEGLYPESTSCAGSYYSPVANHTVSYGGYTITLKYFYNGGCGSFARIENAPTNCSAYLDRSDDGGAEGWVNTSEPVEAGLTYAYTKIGNNLDGRVSRAALVCNDGVVDRTNWY
ncbi:hypothetical protein AB0D14_00840 [Streptomyces sp. NPDC048484]|uniref:hypothetical protein n=1 Tax=Streptomyces sp. NPDC048484 TaxID=3155146 RepID=UPI0034214557